MQPSMEACAWIHQAQDRSWRPYVMRTSDAVMRTSLSHVYYPWQVFQRWQLQSPEGPLYQGSATQDAWSIKFFPRPATTLSQARWRDGNYFRGGATNLNLSRYTTDGCCYYHFKTSFKQDRNVSAGRGLADPERTSTEGAAPTTPPGGVIDRMRHWSIVGSVGPLHGPGRQRLHASAGQPGRP